MAQINLQKSVVNKHWNDLDSRTGRIVHWMESMEPWKLDDDEQVLKALNLLVKNLDGASAERIRENCDELISILAYVSFPTALRILQWLDEKRDRGSPSSSPKGLVAELLDHARGQSDDARYGIFIERLQTLKSLSLLGLIFSPSRTRLLAEILRQESASESEHVN